MRPVTEAEMAEAIRDAAGPLAIRGGGTRGIGRPVAGEVLETGGLSGIVHYEPGALTLVAKAGTPLADVNALLAAEGQRLPFEPPDFSGLLGTSGQSTLGGVVAANASGPRRVQVGACRDSLIGLRFVDGTGTVIKNGGRVMKNVTGYDLVKLLAGSYGTLGVITEVAFKLQPIPEQTAMIVIRGMNVNDAVGSISAALGSPFGVSGAAHVLKNASLTSNTYLRIEGFAESVSYRVKQLKILMGGLGEMFVVMGNEISDEHWQYVGSAEPVFEGPHDIWRISVKPSDAPGILARLPQDMPSMFDWGGGLVWASVAPGTDLRALIGPFAGHATLMRASVETRRNIATFQPEPPGVAALTAGLRAKFDPRGVLNSGIMG